MKTPREILLNHHQTAEGRLDQIRQDVVDGMRRQETSAGARSTARELPLLTTAALKLWRELVLPSRGIWAGLAAVWLVILGCHFGCADRPKQAASDPAVPPQELRAALVRHRQLLAEFALLPSVPAVQSRQDHLRPRSDRRNENAAA